VAYAPATVPPANIARGRPVRNEEAEGRMARTTRHALTLARLGQILGQVAALLALLLVGVILLSIVTLLMGR
jgi:hypothetical protein